MDEAKIRFSHRPVMLDECIEGLCIVPNGLYADFTAGGGGHSSAIAERLGEGGRLISIDQDAAAIAACRERLACYGDRVELVHRNYSEIADILDGRQLNGFLVDLGVSSYQLDTPERGFSYMHDAPLDMRMDQSRPTSAADVVNGYSEQELTRILFEYGEERFAPRIAREICRARESAPLRTTAELSELVKNAIPKKAREGGHHPAKRTFQAIRIEVNGELACIEPSLRTAVHALKPGGRGVVITFHSLEDRITKQTFADLAKGCVCPPDFPVCVCGRKPVVRVVNRKPIIASAAELEENPRARSAKVRIIEKL